MTLEAPELPLAARPRWPAWYAPVALAGGLMAVTAASIPVVPVLLVADVSETLGAISLLVLLLLQDAVLVGAAILFAGAKLRPRRWHFGVRPTRLWPTAGWATLGFAVMIGFELGYVALFHVGETNVDELGKDNAAAGIAVALATVVVAPVAEEFFFRGFFYRALRTRLPVWAAATIDGLVFGGLHFQGTDTAIILPIIAVFGVGQCLVYERTRSLFAVIGIHATFNTVAMGGVATVAAIALGALVVLGCVVVPARLRPSPAPLPA
jgi:uncharacterized protein